MKKLLVFTFSIFISYSTYAQPELGECDQEVEEIAASQLPKALKNWKAKNYREAERYLKKAVSLDPNYADALYLLGDFYIKQRQIDKAEPLWLKLLEVCPNYKAEVKYFVGVILMENGKRPEAIAMFESFLSDPERDRGYDKEVRSALKEAQLMDELLSNPVAFNPTVVQRISTQEDEYLASISPDQQKMFFTRKTKKVNRMDGPAAKVRMVEEFCMAERNGTNGDFEIGVAMPPPFNTSFNEGGPSISADNSEIYFTVCQDLKGYINCDVYFSERDGYGGWTTPKSVGDHINNRDSWESQPTVSANGDLLFFTSNREGGLGGLDLYYCTREVGEDWSAPKNVGAPVNTRKNEKTPFLHSDSKTLYFSSDGLEGMGAFDIYYAKASNDSVWDEPMNIGYPINTKEDDLGLFVSLDGQTGYFASTKYRAQGGWDVFEFSLPEKARPEEVSLITGTLVDEYDEPIKDATVEVKNLKTKEITKVRVDEETGTYARVVSAKPDQDVIITVKKKGAAFSSKYVSSKELKGSQVVDAPLVVATLEIGKEYKLNDINFESNSYDLDIAAESVIDEFILFLKDNPELKADIQGHTDNVGNPSANQTLSHNRSKTVYDYVLNHGIDASRVSFHGYGETRPIAPNNTEEGRAKNRRTVFVITSK
ncbi:OmpA family protein [Owenweeksia hongkongensis]|uniref:OmpA family protein n=1 Tax=Owenweeksia hongkongensis TaxID=253245 RepID=UPI003A91BAA5